MSLEPEELENAVNCLPRHTIHAVFTAYANYVTEKSRSAFLSLLRTVPNLDQQVFHKVQELRPGMDWDSWLTELEEAMNNPDKKKEMADSFLQLFYCSSRRALLFD
jgi:hypothetical protein